MSNRVDFDSKAYNPAFQWSFLTPKYWGLWLAMPVIAIVALLPNRIRVWLSNKVANYLINKKSTAFSRADINLQLCFPKMSAEERCLLIENSFTCAGAFLLGFASLTTRSSNWLNANTVINGLNNLTEHTDSKTKVILLVPHTWIIDIPAVLLASKGMPVVGFVKKQKNELTDWLMHKQRIQYGGRIYERGSGIKPFVKSITQGYLGYYLPDQDHGPEHSIFTDFFATKKATLPGLGKLARISKAKVVPIFSSYNVQTGQYQLDIYPALEDFPTGKDELDARVTNQYIESVVEQKPEQYMWNLQLLRTQQDGHNPYRKARRKK